jgi:hypothetical protein
MSQYTAIQDNGKRCNKHLHQANTLDDNANARKELVAKRKAALKIIRSEYFNRPVDVGLQNDPAELARYYVAERARYYAAANAINLQYHQEKAELELRIVENTRANIDRD